MIARLAGVQAVIHTFPEETDEELKRLFVLEVAPTDVDSILKELDGRADIEYVERAPKRKLIR